MTHVPGRVRAAVLVAFPLLASSILAQNAISRTPDGRADFQGTYRFDTMTPVERPPEFADKPFLSDIEAAEYVSRRLSQRSSNPAAMPYDEVWLERPDELIMVNGRRLSSRVVDPAHGRIPALTLAAQQRLAAASEERRLRPADGPEARSLPERCMTPSPIIEPGGESNLLQIVQTPDHLVIHTELMNVARIIPIGRAATRPMSLPSRGGYSVGHWEGDTLVVNTGGYIGPFGFTFVAADENLSVTEKLRSIDAETLLYESTIDDPTAYVQPWTLVLTLRRTVAPMFEFACHEGNYALTGILRGARDEERRAPPGR